MDAPKGGTLEALKKVYNYFQVKNYPFLIHGMKRDIPYWHAGMKQQKITLKITKGQKGA